MPNNPVKLRAVFAKALEEAIAILTLAFAALAMAFAALAMAFAAPPPAAAYAYDKVPVLMRIGLYSNSSWAEHQAQNSYQVYCEDGISMGCMGWDSAYTFLYDFATPSKAEQMGLSKLAFGKKFAVVTGRDAASFGDVAKRVDGLKKKGYDPHLAYINGWVLIAGYYETGAAAEQAVGARYSNEFPGSLFTVEELASKYILVTIGKDRQFIFDAGASSLLAIPKKSPDGSRPQLIELNGKQYRGAVELVANSGNSLTAINVVLTDEYLYGVVPREIGSGSPPEALKAQAVAARTFSVNSLGRHGDSGFDMCSTTHCQVYGGYAWEDERSNRAVAETAGRVVTYNGALAQVFYFDSSGGHTEDVRNVWGMSSLPYLCGVEDSYESGDSQYYNWETTYTAGEIKSRLAQNGVHIGDITGVAVTKTSAAGYATEVTVTGTNGTKVYTNGSCRTFVSNLRSQKYTVFASGGAAGGKPYSAVGGDGAGTVALGGSEAVGADGSLAEIKGNGGTAVSAEGLAGFSATGSTFRFVGMGWGHGVGMSQEGAKGMARAGFNYAEILAHYFPGCVVR